MSRAAVGWLLGALAVLPVIAAGCGDTEASPTIGSEVWHDDPEVELCGPDQLIEKLIAIPNTGALGVTIGGSRYYASAERMIVRSYSAGAPEQDLARMGAAMADYWSPGTSSLNTFVSGEATVNITTSTGPLYPGCEQGVSGDCWFAGTSCIASYATNVADVRVCTVWKIGMNWPSMYLWADSRGIPRENVVLVAVAHEVGHTMGLPHRNGTVMAPGIPVPGSGSTTWDNLPRFDACQQAAMIDYFADSSDEVIYLPEPEECQ